MDHTESILHLKKILHPDFIKKIIPLIEKKATENLTIEKMIVDKNIRNVKGFTLNFKTPTNLFYWNFIKSEIHRLYLFYKGKFPKMQSKKLAQIDLLKYTSGGKYDVHVDNYSDSTRHLSIIFNLNDEYEGGDLIFTDQKDQEIKRLKLDVGDAVFFPSNFMYPHGITPIIEGTRYSIVAWLR
jgi:Rps23 Pro-64 3,4-dihydroxylase Tpa1-like proline 4-hydroxylase|tara:strand:+ start:321 stop:869 length:549 start_codon:yes stop_codon:yes gene_type:complete